MLKVSDALELSRSFFHDNAQLEWTDSVLMPRVRQAHAEIIQKMILNGMQVIKEETTSLTITAGSTSLGIQQPTDLNEPIDLKEYAMSETSDQAVPMVRRDFIPNWAVGENLRVWAWRENVVNLLPATTDRKVILYYKKGIVAPTQVTDPLSIIGSEIYIGPRVAALSALPDKELYAAINSIADTNLSMLVRSMVKSNQQPVRRRPFSNRFRRGRGLNTLT
jgi:hypothetical protein